jgi:hypothetical protein
MDAHVLTFATHKEGTFDDIINNKFNIPIKVLGYGQKWTGFRMKFDYVYDYIQDLNDNEIVFFIDGFDSYINGDLDVAVERFNNMNETVVFSLQCPISAIFPLELNKILVKNAFGSCHNGLIANSGLYVGYVKYLKIFLKEAVLQKCNDDQRNLNTLCKKYDFRKVDRDNKIFKNISNITELEKSNAIFVQFPGTPSFNRITRGIFEYIQFVLVYFILLFLIILIYIFMYVKKPFYYYLITLIIYIYLLFTIDKSCL